MFIFERTVSRSSLKFQEKFLFSVGLFSCSSAFFSIISGFFSGSVFGVSDVSLLFSSAGFVLIIVCLGVSFIVLFSVRYLLIAILYAIIGYGYHFIVEIMFQNISEHCR
ncbi:hypothetical protein IKN40_04030 [bacterium]|nr:hypothetical protein [bacterium]